MSSNEFEGAHFYLSLLIGYRITALCTSAFGVVRNANRPTIGMPRIQRCTHFTVNAVPFSYPKLFERPIECIPNEQYAKATERQKRYVNLTNAYGKKECRTPCTLRLLTTEKRKKGLGHEEFG